MLVLCDVIHDYVEFLNYDDLWLFNIYICKFYKTQHLTGHSFQKFRFSKIKIHS